MRPHPVLLVGLALGLPSPARHRARPTPIDLQRSGGAIAVSRISNAESRVPAVTSLAVRYTNTRYGFAVTLPDGWKGYGTIEERWRGYALQPDGTTGPDTVTGPQITLRHPLWTESQPRQDIPIMVFTREQWRLVAQETLAVSAAPIGPRVLARNHRYVFALPPRYDFAALPGSEEVEGILSHGAVRPL